MAEDSPVARPVRSHGSTPPHDGHPTPDMSELIEVTRECTASWQTMSLSLSVPGARENTFRAGFPLAAHAMNCVQVAVDCWDRFPWVATANARIAFEHALVAQWLFVTPDGPQHFVNVATHNDLVAAKEFSDAIAGQSDLTALVDPAMLTDFETYTAREYQPGNERKWSIKRLLERFDQSGLLYSSYRSLSRAVHPSTGTVAAHLDVAADVKPQLHRSGHGSSDLCESAQGLALAALWGLNFVEKCRDSYVSPGQAGTIAIPHHLPYDLAHSDQPQPTSSTAS